MTKGHEGRHRSRSIIMKRVYPIKMPVELYPYSSHDVIPDELPTIQQQREV